MRTICTLLLLSPLLGYGQHLLPKNQNGEVEFGEVIQVDSTPVETLHNRSKIFLAELLSTFSCSKPSLGKPDETTVNGFIPVLIDNKFMGDVRFSFTLHIKENAYQYVFNHLSHYFITSGRYFCGGEFENDEPIGILPREAWLKVRVSTADKINNLVSSLKNCMKTANSGIAQASLK